MKHAVLRVLSWMGLASRSAAEWLAPLLAESLAGMLSGLAPIALEVVASLASTDKSGADKRRIAQRTIRDLAVAEGVKVTSRAINLAIELALERLEPTP